MKILLCVKESPCVDAVFAGPWETEANPPRLVTKYVKRELGAYDEGAAELCLRLKDKTDTHFLTAITADGPLSERMLKNLLAVGFDEAVRIDPGNTDLRFNPNATAMLLTTFAQLHGPFDLIVSGAQGTEGGSSKVPPLLAEALNLPFVPNLNALALTEDGSITFTCDGVTGSLPLPAVVSVGNMEAAYLRVPTLKAKMASAKQAITVINAEDQALPNPDCVLETLQYMDKSRTCQFIQAENASEAAQQLLALFEGEDL